MTIQIGGHLITITPEKTHTPFTITVSDKFHVEHLAKIPIFNLAKNIPLFAFVLVRNLSLLSDTKIYDQTKAEHWRRLNNLK